VGFIFAYAEKRNIAALIALDDWYIALQRIRDVVAAAETHPGWETAPDWP
jgi:hypothetical protein